jgi:colanic acid biosynthesis glycosyl transferase WcaI
MRIIILKQFSVPDISPTAHLAASLAEDRAGKGDQVTVVTSRGGYVAASADAATEHTANPRVFRIWTPRLGKATVLKRCIDYGVFYLLACWRMATLPPQDIIISLTTPPFIAWAAILHTLLHPRRTKLVLWNMDCYPEMAERSGKLTPGGLPARLMRAMNRAMFRRLDHLVCLDTAMVELLMSQYAPKPTKARPPLPVTVIPNWERASFFPPPPEREQAQAHTPRWDEASKLGLDGRFVILYLGNLGYGHSFETVIDAAAMLRDEPVTFLFIGGGTRVEFIEAATKSRALDNIIMRGYVPKEQTPAVMAAADCALITLRDGILGVMSPSKLHANLAMGLPVVYVGPRTSNVDDAIGRFGCGVSLRHGDAAGLAAYVRALMGDRARHAQQRDAARRAFDEAYCDRRTLEQFDGVLRSLAPREHARIT